MAQVETLLENAVDRNFDAFELYVLRNVFNVPEEVEGYLRLQHHQVFPREIGRVDFRDWILRLRRNRIRNLIRLYSSRGNGFRRCVPVCCVDIDVGE